MFLNYIYLIYVEASQINQPTLSTTIRSLFESLIYAVSEIVEN